MLVAGCCYKTINVCLLRSRRKITRSCSVYAMAFYSWLITAAWIHAALARLLSPEDGFEFAPNCTSPSFVETPSWDLFQEFASRFCPYAESQYLLTEDTIERSYLLNKIWYSFSVEQQPACSKVILQSSLNMMTLCRMGFDAVWDRCKNYLSSVSSV